MERCEWSNNINLYIDYYTILYNVYYTFSLYDICNDFFLILTSMKINVQIAIHIVYRNLWGSHESGDLVIIKLFFTLKNLHFCISFLFL